MATTGMPAQNEAIGKAVGPYRIIAPLGQGGEGCVYRARDERLDRWVAMKHLRPDLADDPVRMARFRREARVIASLSHPAIVGLYDIVDQDHGDWIVMEYVDGTTLAELIDDGLLDLATALACSRQIIAGLVAAHDKGIVHRDLKTENVMLTSSNNVKILDFGLARPFALYSDEAMASGSLTGSGRIVGTPRAMSPEQARGFAVDARSDLFSLGTLLYEMFTGVAPFRGQNSLDTMIRVIAHEHQPVHVLAPNLPRRISDLIDRLLAKQPQWRPQSARAVADELDEILAGSGAQRVRTMPSWQRYGTPALAAILLAVAATLLATLLPGGSSTTADKALESADPADSHIICINPVDAYCWTGDRLEDRCEFVITHKARWTAGK